MKRILIVLLLSCIGATAQNIDVKSFQLLPTAMTATSLENRRFDRNGDVAALIRVVTTEKGFNFEGGTLGIVDTQERKGEIWVWVPRGLRKITILHDKLGVLRDWRFPIEIESERTYEMILTTGKVETIVTQSFTNQFLVFNIKPKDALLTVDGKAWILNDGVAQDYVPFGTYEYSVAAPDYHSDAGKITVDDPDNSVVVNVELKPNFGYLEITGNKAMLSAATIFIDNGQSNNILQKPQRLKSGQHRIKVIHPKYKQFERVVTINDEKTTTLDVNLDANYSKVTLKVDLDAEIYVNTEFKGVGTWTGDLNAGTYVVETRKKGYRSITEQKVITEKMSGETIELKAPIPINGTLVVSSTPTMAKLFVDGKEVGETPKRINAILIGEHTVRIEKQGCAPVSRTVTIEEGKTLTIEEKLDTGRNITVKTDLSGDQVYVDDEYVGETPLTTSVGFGKHTLRAVRGQAKAEKEIELTPTSRNDVFVLEFGRLIKITTDRPGDKITIDGKPVGSSPVQVDLPFGRHNIYAKRGKKFAGKSIEVGRTGGSTEHHLILRGETATEFVQRGVNFLTFDAAYSVAPQLSYGITFGSVRRAGWFFTAASNFDFDAMNYSATANSFGFVEDENENFYYYDYNGESCSTRISVMGGLVVRVAGPVYWRLGAGVGTRVKSWYTNNGELVKLRDDSPTGIDAISGLQLNLKGLSLSFDAVTTNFETLELKLGLGFCWKKR